jgi:hypothetical protein
MDLGLDLADFLMCMLRNYRTWMRWAWDLGHSDSLSTAPYDALLFLASSFRSPPNFLFHFHPALFAPLLWLWLASLMCTNICVDVHQHLAKMHDPIPMAGDEEEVEPIHIYMVLYIQRREPHTKFMRVHGIKVSIRP